MSQPEQNTITILNAALDEYEGKTVLRGVVSPESLQHLLVDDYQREKLAVSSRENIRTAIDAGERLPDIELGMRGEQFDAVILDGVEQVILKDPVYLIDGLQRRETIIEFLTKNCDAHVRIGALIHFDTTREWERARFYNLNKHRIGVSPNILLRNMREGNTVLTMLWGLTHTEKTFVLHDRVQWRQQMARVEILTASTLVRVVGLLHSHRLPGRDSGVVEVVTSLNNNLEKVGIQAMRENTRLFFTLVDECWGVQKVHFRGAAYLKGGFLTVLARIISDHHDFWKQPDEKRLFIDASLRRKLAKFPVDDPEIARMAGASGMAREHLYQLILGHLNKGKTTKILASRQPTPVELGDGDDAEEESAAA